MIPSNYPPGVTGAEPQIVGEFDQPEESPARTAAEFLARRRVGTYTDLLLNHYTSAAAARSAIYGAAAAARIKVRVQRRDNGAIYRIFRVK